ncbi:MAG: hypothetical protein QME14_04140 [Methanobacteriaceae archaeon]|nr:hypothetical protein [Methanobacteriaceae archaeon]
MKNINIIIFAAILFILSSIFSFYFYSYNVSTYSNIEIKKQILGQEYYGIVIKEGPYGNPSSKVRIAYIVGVHPLESNSHRAAVESLKSRTDSFKYSYYIYNVSVFRDKDNYEQGRMNGQILAKKYVVPDIEIENFDLVVDIHSNRGNYPVMVFVFSPVPNTTAEKYAYKIKDRIPYMDYYSPPHQTCTLFIAIPLIKAGIPTIVYETYIYEPYEITKNHLSDLVESVDNLSFN